MMIMLKQWCVVVKRGKGHPSIEFKVSEMHLPNVLRKIADLDFGDHVVAVEFTAGTRAESGQTNSGLTYLGPDWTTR
jgi:hypothetical protein